MNGILFPRISYGLPACKVCLTTGVPLPSGINVIRNPTYVILRFNFNFKMSGDDHFEFIITNANIEKSFTMRFQPNSKYVVPSLQPQSRYTIKIIPIINGVRYASATTPEF